jgi:uncharacterized protein YecT (DUF1311 family)
MAVRLLQRFLFIGFLSVLAAPAYSQSPKKDMFWEPYLDQPIQQLEEILKELQQQQPMNYTIANISFLYDAKLYILFHKYLETLPASKRSAAIRDQDKWLSKRNKAVDAACAEYEGGSLAPYQGGSVKVEFTKIRIQVIESRLKGTSRDS